MLKIEETGGATSYRVHCDACDREGPAAVSEAQARAMAQEQGFRGVPRWDPREFANADYCPDCYQRWTEREGEEQAERGHQHWTEPDED